MLAACTLVDHAIPTGSLQLVYQFDTILNGVATSNNRVFVCFPHGDGSAGTRIGEVLATGKVVPYPSADWNNWVPGTPPAQTAQKFVRTNF